jgi:hypothetical protein
VLRKNRKVQAMNSKYGLYAYGLVDKSPEPLNILGIDKQNKVFPVEGREICVMVSEIDIDKFQNKVKNLFSELAKSEGIAQSGTEEILQAHENVIDTLMKDTTVVPFKFGTILKDAKAASKMLQDEEEKFKKLLAKFVGRTEWTLKVYADKKDFAKHVVQVDPHYQTLEENRESSSKGTAYLLGKKKEEETKSGVTAHLAEIAEHLFQELGKDADEAKIDKTLPQKLTGKKKDMFLNAVFLVEKEKVAHFCAHEKNLREHYKPMGLDLEVSGPWPPYSFT